MQHLDPYLFFDGHCAEAMRFYERVFKGRIEMMQTWGDSPGAEQVAPDKRNRIMHARLNLGGRALLASDSETDQPFEGIRGFSLSVSFDAVEEAHRVFQGLADGGTVQLPIQETFWAKAFGMLVDRYGTPWMINVNAPEAQ